jgi:hypothetical protein
LKHHGEILRPKFAFLRGAFLTNGKQFWYMLIGIVPNNPILAMAQLHGKSVFWLD